MLITLQTKIHRDFWHLKNGPHKEVWWGNGHLRYPRILDIKGYLQMLTCKWSFLKQTLHSTEDSRLTRMLGLEKKLCYAKFALVGLSPTNVKIPHLRSRTTDTQWRHKSKISEKLGWCGRQNMLWPYLKVGDWEWSAGKAISSLGVRS